MFRFFFVVLLGSVLLVPMAYGSEHCDDVHMYAYNNSGHKIKLDISGDKGLLDYSLSFVIDADNKDKFKLAHLREPKKGDPKTKDFKIKLSDQNTGSTCIINGYVGNGGAKVDTCYVVVTDSTCLKNNTPPVFVRMKDKGDGGLRLYIDGEYPGVPDCLPSGAVVSDS